MTYNSCESLKPCQDCRQQIDITARKCVKCGSFQNWRRHLNFGNALLSLLVALVSVSAFAVPILVKALKEPLPATSAVSVEFIFGKDDDFYFYVNNEGVRPALVESIALKVGHSTVEFAPRNLSEISDPRLIRETSTEVIVINRLQPINNEFAINISGEELESRGFPQLVWGADRTVYESLRDGGTDYPNRPVDLRLIDDPSYDSETRDEFDVESDVQIALYQLQQLQRELDADDGYREIDAYVSDDTYGEGQFAKVARASPSFQPNEHPEPVAWLLEANFILSFLDAYLQRGDCAIEVVIRNSDGKPQIFSFSMGYEQLRSFLRPSLIDLNKTDPLRLTYFLP